MMSNSTHGHKAGVKIQTWSKPIPKVVSTAPRWLLQRPREALMATGAFGAMNNCKEAMKS